MSLKTKLNGFREILKFDNWAELLWINLFNRRRDFFIYTYQGKEFLLKKSNDDINGFRTLLATEEYKPFFRHINPGFPLNVIDAGSNIGGFVFSAFFSGIEFKKIVMVEFNPYTFLRLKLNVTYNLSSEYELLNAALGAQDGTVELFVGPGRSSSSIKSASKDGSGKKRFMLNAVTLDTVYSRFFNNDIVDILKMDIEGEEQKVLMSDSVSALKKIRYLIIETHPSYYDNHDEVLKRIISLGFEEVKEAKSINPFVFLFRNINLFAS
jgi:FkbM family methyltransferase